ncbi:MAG: hypothetical protein CL928_10800 [Deltaproteobacteria bacterium]|nr:hypothetical protein [Deltaproteobacteria bacterium]
MTICWAFLLEPKKASPPLWQMATTIWRSSRWMGWSLSDAVGHNESESTPVTTLTITMVVIALALAVCGIAFSLIPVLPGPPLSAVVLLILQWGLDQSGQATDVGWAVAFSALVVGLGLSAIDMFAPILAERMGQTSRPASLGAYAGMIIGFGLSTVVGIPLAVTGFVTFLLGTVLAAAISIAFVFGMPFVGALVGELVSRGLKDQGDGVPLTHLLRDSVQSATTQWLCLVLTTTFKLVFGIGVLTGAIVLLVVQTT